MLFNSIEYLLFLPVVFLLYWYGFRQRRWQNAFVVVASYVFYGWWDWRFLILIAFTTACSYASGVAIEHFKDNRRRQKLVCAANVIVNLGILGAFKYFNWFVDSLQSLVGIWGWQLDFVTVQLILPVGISFYTFQALSYTIDVYKGKVEPTHDVVAFFAFVSFFPQLVAGPIERASNLLPQFLADRRFSYPAAVDGMRQMLWGFVKKMVIADNCATYVDHIFTHFHTCNSSELILGVLLFSFQIYGDFSGYSDIAIGTAKLFGINLMQNFNYPYFSRNIGEFWHRWHISLTSWFRDYVYFPLGGSRCSQAKKIRNTMAVFVVSGIWHGAKWGYVTWGFFHGLAFVVLMLIGGNKKHRDTVAQGRVLPSLRDVVNMLVTFLFVAFSRLLYRTNSITDSWHYLCRIFTDFSLSLPAVGGTVTGWIVVFMIVEWLQRTKPHALCIDGVPLLRYRAARWALYLGLVTFTLVYSASSQQFIYFQF